MQEVIQLLQAGSTVNILEQKVVEKIQFLQSMTLQNKVEAHHQLYRYAKDYAKIREFQSNVGMQTEILTHMSNYCDAVVQAEQELATKRAQQFSQYTVEKTQQRRQA